MLTVHLNAHEAATLFPDDLAEEYEYLPLQSAEELSQLMRLHQLETAIQELKIAYNECQAEFDRYCVLQTGALIAAAQLAAWNFNPHDSTRKYSLATLPPGLLQVNVYENIIIQDALQSLCNDRKNKNHNTQ